MKKITEWMVEYEGQECAQEVLSLSGEEQERVLRGVMEKIRENVRPMPRHRKPGKFFAIAAAAVVAVMGATVFAAERFSLGDAFSSWMGGASQEQIEALGTSGHPLGLVETVEDVPVTLQGVIGGKNAAYLLYDVQLPEAVNTPGDSFFYFEHERLMPEKSGSYAYHSEFMSREGNTLHFCMYLDSRQNLVGQNVTYMLENLKAVDMNTEESSVIAEGTWSFDFPMRYSDTSVEIPLKEKINPWTNNSITITGIQVSPISVHLECSRSVKGTLEQNDLDSSLLMDMEIRLCFADGSFIDGSDVLTNGAGSHMLEMQLNRSYRRLIDLQQLTEIQLIIEDNGETKSFSVPVSIS